MAISGCWLLLAAAGCWLLLAASGCCWLLLAASGCCWLLVVHCCIPHGAHRRIHMGRALRCGALRGAAQSGQGSSPHRMATNSSASRWSGRHGHQLRQPLERPSQHRPPDRIYASNTQGAHISILASAFACKEPLPPRALTSCAKASRSRSQAACRDRRFMNLPSLPIQRCNIQAFNTRTI